MERKSEGPCAIYFPLRDRIMIIQVQCYSGYKADKRPIRFFLGEKMLDICEILDRWYGEDHEYFNVSAHDGNHYVLRHDHNAGRWELSGYTMSKPGPTGAGISADPGEGGRG
jgi:hypothetical protein